MTKIQTLLFVYVVGNAGSHENSIEWYLGAKLVNPDSSHLIDFIQTH